MYEHTTRHAPAGFSQPLRMQGQYDDSATGLYYNMFRYYDADAGRYISEDPIALEGGMNLYAYAGGDPVNAIDPKGLMYDYDDWQHDTDYEGSLYPGQTAYIGGGWSASEHRVFVGRAEKGGKVIGTDGKICTYRTKCLRIGPGIYAGGGGEAVTGSGRCNTEGLLSGLSVGIGFDFGAGLKGFGGSVSAGSSGVGLGGSRFGGGFGVVIGVDICRTEVSCD